MTTVASKAARLRTEGNVSQVPGKVYLVHGDTGSYLVAVTDPDALEAKPGLRAAPNINCSCPTRGVCSHAVAATAMFLVERAERAELVR